MHCACGGGSLLNRRKNTIIFIRIYIILCEEDILVVEWILLTTVVLSWIRKLATALFRPFDDLPLGYHR